MKTKILVFGTLALIFMVIIFFSFMKTEVGVSKSNTIQQDSVITGQELFRLNCAGCHGADLKGNPPTYPSLLNVKDKLTKEEIQTQIKNGKGSMPPMAHLSGKEINTIIGFLYNEEEERVIMTYLTPVKQGEMLFKSNCASCHRATTNDSKPQNANTKMCSMMEPAVLAGITNRFTKEEFFNILETGICYMPSFAHFNEEEKEALYTFLKTLKGEGEPSRPTMMGKCPMMKRKLY